MVCLIIPLAAVATDDVKRVVLDRDGQPLRAGEKYYVRSGLIGATGGLTLKKRSNTCPMYVAYDNSHLIPVVFRPHDLLSATIDEGVDLNVEMAAPCAQSTTWAIQADPKGEVFVVATTEKAQSSSSVFTINSDINNLPGNNYVLAFSPQDSSLNDVKGTLGIYNEDANAWVLVGSPARFLPVQFEKVKE